jgi:hypothetical protein
MHVSKHNFVLGILHYALYILEFKFMILHFNECLSEQMVSSCPLNSNLKNSCNYSLFACQLMK